MSSDLRSRIREALERFQGRTDPDPLNLRTIAAERAVLPVVRGWEVLGAVTLDGVPVEVSYDAPYEITEVQDRGAAVAILAFCAARFPELAELRPTRPPEAFDCVFCGGSGRSSTSSDGVCLCGGLGWMTRGAGAA